MPFFGLAFRCNLLAEGFSFQFLTGITIRLNKNIPVDPTQYTGHISLYLPQINRRTEPDKYIGYKDWLPEKISTSCTSSNTIHGQSNYKDELNDSSKNYNGDKNGW